MIVRPARSTEAQAISDLALRSKALWGYSRDFLDRCRRELTIQAEDLTRLRAHVAEEEGHIQGFFTVSGDPPEGELDALYVDPAAIGRGVGRALWHAALERSRKDGFRALAIHADPHAEAFYVRHGARRVGEAPSGSIPGRRLPHLRVEL